MVNVNADRCVECMRCKSAQNWRHDALWAHASGSEPLEGRFKRSIHVRIVDAGDCGACLNELSQLNGPSYNLHRFGIFITPTPRQADVLLVVGPVTRQMLDPLKLAYEAMPAPKRVIAVGACAASGGIFGPSVMCAGGAAGCSTRRLRGPRLPAAAACNRPCVARDLRTGEAAVNQWTLVLTGISIAIAVAGAVASMLAPERRAATVLAITSCISASAALIAGAGTMLGSGSAERLLWSFPVLGSLAVGTTPLGAIFACIAALVYVPTSLYSVRYLERYEPEYSARAFACWYCLSAGCRL